MTSSNSSDEKLNMNLWSVMLDRWLTIDKSKLHNQVSYNERGEVNVWEVVQSNKVLV